jgi:endonuclease/exonuclease/phosphatase (EEP) superfamily protein YafD
LDHLFVRGFTVLSAHSPGARSSDHNPILVRLRSQRSSGP